MIIQGVINFNDVVNKHKGRHAQTTLTVPKEDVILVLPC